MQAQFQCHLCHQIKTSAPIILQGVSYCLPCAQSFYQPAQPAFPAVPNQLQPQQPTIPPVGAAYPMQNTAFAAGGQPQLYPGGQEGPPAYAPQQTSDAFGPPLAGNSSAVAAMGTLSLWRCQECTYEYNRVTDKGCQRCGKLREGVRLQASDGGRASRDMIWTCVKCGYSFNLPDDSECTGCGTVRPGQSNRKSAGIDTNAPWKCSTCQQENYFRNEYCNSCGGKKPSGVEVKLTLVGNKWRCDCGHLTPVMMSRCQACGKLSRDIDLIKEAFGLK